MIFFLFLVCAAKRIGEVECALQYAIPAYALGTFLERLASLGIMGDQLRASLKPLNTRALYCSQGFQGVSSIWHTWLPRDASLSHICTSDRCRFYSPDTGLCGMSSTIWRRAAREVGTSRNHELSSPLKPRRTSWIYGTEGLRGSLNWAHIMSEGREFYFEACEVKLNLDRNFPVNLASYGIPFGAKSIG